MFPARVVQSWTSPSISGQYGDSEWRFATRQHAECITDDRAKVSVPKLLGDMIPVVIGTTGLLPALKCRGGSSS
jgi:hypothetical protein